MRTTYSSGRSWAARLSMAAVATAAVTATVSGCGSSTGSPTTPSAALAASVASLAGNQHLSLKLSLTGAVDQLEKTGSGGPDSPAVTAAIKSGYIGIGVNTDGATKVNSLDVVVHANDSDIGEIRYVSSSVYAHLDTDAISKIAGKPFPASGFADAASSFKLPILAALGQGKWVGITNLQGTLKAITAEEKTLLASTPAGASGLPTSPDDVAKLRSSLLNALTTSATVTDLPGSSPDSVDRKLSVAVSPKQLVTSLKSALSTFDSLAPGLSSLSTKANSLGSKTFKLEVDTSGGKISRIDLPINQFLSASDQATMAGQSADVVLAISESAPTVSVPAGATTTDGTAIVNAFKQLEADEKDAENGFSDGSSSDSGGLTFGDDSSGSGDSSDGSLFSNPPSAAPIG